MLTLDLPPEEGEDLFAAARAHGLDTIVHRGSDDPRLPARADRGGGDSGFIYYVSREGVTGVRAQAAGGCRRRSTRIRRHTSLPVAVGFGIATRAHVAQAAASADGVVVGARSSTSSRPTFRTGPGSARN